jgi:outer membrane protein TolC
MGKRLALLAVALCLTAAPVWAEDLTLDRAIDLALRQNTALRQADYQAKAADWGVAQAVSVWLPRVSYNTTWSRVDDETYDKAQQSYEALKRLNPSTERSVWENNYSSSITVLQPVFNGGAEAVTIATGALSRDSAQFTFQDTRLQTVLEVKRAYHGALKARALAQVARESQALVLESLRLARARLEIGSATQSDLLRWEAELARAEGTLVEADNAFALAKMALAQLIGGPLDANWTLPDVRTELLEADVQRAEKSDLAGDQTPLGVGAHPAMQAADTTVALAQTQTAGSAGRLLPNINFSYTYSWDTNDTFAPDGDTSWTMGVAIEIPLFQGFGAITGIGQSARQQQAARLGATTAERAFLQRAYAAKMTVRASRLRVQSANKAIASSRANLDIVEKRAELGMAASLEQLDAQLAYLTAKSNLIGAVSDFNIALAEWDYVTSRSDN